jgi:hypothetical protein
MFIVCYLIHLKIRQGQEKNFMIAGPAGGPDDPGLESLKAVLDVFDLFFAQAAFDLIQP